MAEQDWYIRGVCLLLDQIYETIKVQEQLSVKQKMDFRHNLDQSINHYFWVSDRIQDNKIKYYYRSLMNKLEGYRRKTFQFVCGGSIDRL